jgi:predicted metal-dependent hydrolase
VTSRLHERPPRTVTIDGDPVSVRVRVSATARTTRLRVGPDHPPEIIVPAGTGDASIDEALHSRHAWLRTKLAAARTVEQRPAALGLTQPGIVWVDLVAVPVERRPDLSDGASLHHSKLIVGGREHNAAAAIGRWYRREARRRLLDVAEREAGRLDVAFRSLAVRDQRTRWGSCSAARNLSFNWRLLVAPAYVRTYVVVHELCHLRVANHSKEFWRMVDAAAPGWHGASAWLRDHGRELRGYDVASALSAGASD